MPVNIRADKARRYPGRQRGLTLFEVLITLFVLSLGLLGLAGLQITGLRDNHSAYLRSQATVLGYDMADRLRADRNNALTGAYDIALADASPTGSSLADLEVAQWRTLLGQELPLGTGAVVRAGSLFTITVQWDDSKGANPAEQFIFQTEL